MSVFNGVHFTEYFHFQDETANGPSSSAKAAGPVGGGGFMNEMQKKLQQRLKKTVSHDKMECCGRAV